MDNLHYRLLKNEIPGNDLLKIVKFQNLVEKCCNVWKIQPFQSLQIIYIIVLRVEIATTFGSKMVTISARNTKI